MPVIFLLVFVQAIYAQSSMFSHLADCKPDELAPQCFASLCSESLSKSLIPQKEDDFYQALEKHPFAYPSQVAKNFKQFVYQVERVSGGVDKFYENGGSEKMVQEILANPLQYRMGLEAYFGDYIHITYDAGTISATMTNVELNSFDSFSKVFDFLKELTQYDLKLARRDELQKIRPNNPFFSEILRESAAFLAERKDPQAAKLLKLAASIDKMKEPFKNWTLFDSVLKREVYSQMLAKKFQSVEKDLAVAIAVKNATREKDKSASLSPSDTITRSCRFADYMLSKLKGRDTAKEFNLARIKLTQRFNEKFLKNLCPEAANLLRARFKQLMFKSPSINAKFYPNFAKLTASLQKFSAETTKDVLELSRWYHEHAEEFTCRTDAYFPTDQYDSGKIQVSPYTFITGQYQVMDHELGHWISSTLSDLKPDSACRKRFLELRKCLSEFYDVAPKSEYSDGYQYDRLYTEEDFADWVAAKLGDQDLSFFCQTAQLDPLITSFLSNETVQTELYKPDSEDTHSSVLFRILHIKLIGDQALPKSCLDVIKNHPEAAPKKCDF